MSTYYIHKTAIVDEAVSIGLGTKIWHWSHVSKHSTIGENCVIGQNVFVGEGVTVGNNVKIQNNVSVYSGVIIEDNVFCGPSMVFTNVINPRSKVDRKSEFKTTVVRNGSTIGANATIVCGNELAEHCFIGAGSVITKSVPRHALMVGNPARLVGWMCECGEKLPKSVHSTTVCDACGSIFAVNANSCVKTK